VGKDVMDVDGEMMDSALSRVGIMAAEEMVREN
jgi:hypothetical protein